MQPILRTAMTGTCENRHHGHRLLTRKFSKTSLHETSGLEDPNLKNSPEYLHSLAWRQDTERSLDAITMWSLKDILYMVCGFQAKEVLRYHYMPIRMAKIQAKASETLHGLQPIKPLRPSQINTDYFKTLWS